LPVTTESPVSEIVPPSIPKELAALRSAKIELPKAGITAAIAITNQINLCRILPPSALRLRLRKTATVPKRIDTR
jgi:hypothetical protein